MFIPLNSSSSLIPVDGSAAVVGSGVVVSSVGASVVSTGVSAFVTFGVVWSLTSEKLTLPVREFPALS